MPKVISNTSGLIILSNIGQFDILHGIYGTLLITPEVAAEFGESLPEWIQVRAVQDSKKIQMLENTLDLGEASTIALAIETPDSLMILDDRKARRMARNLDMYFTGTLGVISKAYKSGMILDISKVINDLYKSNFRIPDNIEALILKQ
jgi:predicted nucleic acid-binding protein